MFETHMLSINAHAGHGAPDVHFSPYRSARTSHAGAELRLLEPHEEPTTDTPTTSDGDFLARTCGGVEAFTMEYRLPGEAEPRQAAVAYHGRMLGQALIVGAAPIQGAFSWGGLVGLPVRCRLTTGADVHTFESAITHYHAQPIPHLYLRQPLAVNSQRYRRSVRVKTHLPAVVTVDGQPSVQALVTNLSEHGVEFRSAYLMSEVGARLQISFPLPHQGTRTPLTLAGYVRSRQTRSESVTVGLQFDPAAFHEHPNLLLLLRSHVYEQLVG